MKNFIIVMLLGLFVTSCGGGDDSTETATCSNPQDLQSLNDGPGNTILEWTSSESEVSSYTVEYGFQGFVQGLGTGTQVTTTSRSYSLTNLNPNTSYDFYVRTNCTDDLSSDFSGPSTFTTEDIPCEQISGVEGTLIMEDSALIFWDAAPVGSYQVEYGEAGFTIGSGTIITTDETNVTIKGLTADTSYHVYVKANCGSGVSGDYSDVYEFTTKPICRVPLNFRLFQAGQTSVLLAWDSTEPTIQIEYGAVGFVLGTGTVVNASGSSVTITGLTPNTVYESYIRSNCGSEGFSEWSSNLVFATNP